MGIHRKIAISGFISFLSCSSIFGHAATLSEAYRAATENDPYLRAAYHSFEAGREEEKIGRSQLLPEVTFVARESDNTSKRKAMGVFGPINDAPHYKSSTSGVYLRQPLVNLEKYAIYQQGVLQTEIAEKQFQSEQSDFVIRVVSSYLDAVVAKAEMDLAGTQVRVAQEKYRQAEKALVEGEAIKLDVESAGDEFRLAEMQQNLAAEKFRDAVKAIEEISGLSIKEMPGFRRLQNDAENLLTLDQAIELAAVQNPYVQEKELAVAVAKKSLSRIESNHLPTLDLTASYSKSNQEGISTLGQQYRTNSVGLEMQWPILEGGRTLAMARQAQSQYLRAEQDVRIARTEVRQEVRLQHRTANISREKARILGGSIESGERNLEAARMGFRLGLRTLVDVADAEKNLSQAVYQFADTLRNYLVARIKLDALTGTLREERVVWADQYIEPSTSH